jgi:hypothetical protein
VVVVLLLLLAMVIIIDHILLRHSTSNNTLCFSASGVKKMNKILIMPAVWADKFYLHLPLLLQHTRKNGSYCERRQR